MVSKLLQMRRMAACAAAFLISLAASAQALEPVRIGVPTAITGPYADIGGQAKRAIDLAVEQANAAGGVAGRKVEVRFLDSEGKPDVARTQAEKLALSGYKLLTGTIASGEGLAIAPMLERWDALFVSAAMKSNRLTGDSCTKRFFRVNRNDASDAAVVQPWLATRKETKWAIMAVDAAWGRDTGGSFTKAAQAVGKSVVSPNYAPFGTTDFAPYIQKIRDSGADGLWVALAGADAITFARQAKQFGLLDKLTTAGVSFVMDQNVRTLGDISKGIWSIINYSSTLDTPANKTFVAAFRKKYDIEPTNLEGETYIAMQVLFQAVERAKSTRPADLVKVMEGQAFDTILGKQLMRKEDHQLVAPNYFGVIEEQGGSLKPVIKTVMLPDVAQSPVDPACRMPP